MSDRALLLGMAALHCTLAKMSGFKLDKAAMRFTAMADYMEHVVACGTSVDPLSALDEAVSTAIIGDPMHTGLPFCRQNYAWMEAKP
jgi:hypothetical protein